MNELMTRVFENEEFGQVRTIVENGEVLFCGTDVARALKYARPLNAISQHCPHSLKRGVGVQTGVKADGTPAMQTVEMIFIPEGDVYRLVVHSRLETAVRFERWLFDEVLPTLRKTGMYAMLPQDYPSALRALADSVEERLRLEAKIEEDRPKVEFAETVRGSSKCMRIGDFSKFLQQRGVDIKPHQLFELLRMDGYLMRKGTDNVPTQKSISMGLMQMREYPVYKSGGRVEIKITPLLTGKGQLYFMEKYGWNNVGNGAMIGGAAFVQNGV